MAELKTQPNDQDVETFINSIPDENKRKDCFELIHLMQEITKTPPVMWGPSIVGFDTYHYKYESGREGDFLLTGFSPRKQNISIYNMAGFEKYESIMSRLGKYKTGKSCLYVKRLSDIDTRLLRQLITESCKAIKKKYS